MASPLWWSKGARDRPTSFELEAKARQEKARVETAAKAAKIEAEKTARNAAVMQSPEQRARSSHAALLRAVRKAKEERGRK